MLVPIAAISELNNGLTLANQTGTMRRVANPTNAWFELDREHTLTPDGITTVAATGGGTWIRRPCQFDYDANPTAESTALYVNTSTGNDEADGAVGTPLKSVAEWKRRIGSCRQKSALTIHVTGDDTAAVLGGTWDATTSVTIIADWKTAVYSSTIASWTGIVYTDGLEEFFVISLAGLGDISPYCGYPYIAHIVGGDRDGAIATFALANPRGAGTQYARCTGWTNASGDRITPQVGDTVEITTRYKAKGLRWTGRAPYYPYLYLRYFDLVGTSDVAEVTCPSVSMCGCALNNVVCKTPYLQNYGVHYYGSSQAHWLGLLDELSSGVQDANMNGCLVTVPTLRVVGGMTTAIASLWQGGNLRLRGNGIRWRHQGCGHFDCTEGAAIIVETSQAQLYFDSQYGGRCVGGGNAIGLQILRDGTVVTANGAELVPALRGTTADLRILGTNFAWTEMPATVQGSSFHVL